MLKLKILVQLTIVVNFDIDMTLCLQVLYASMSTFMKIDVAGL